jgi:hypothetical protein
VPLERLQTLAIVEADDIVPGHGFGDRNSRYPRYGCARRGFHSKQSVVDNLDEMRELAYRDCVMGHEAGNDLRGQLR